MDATITTLEDTAYVFRETDFSFTDSNEPAPFGPNSLRALKITTLPTLGALTDNGKSVDVGQFIPIADVLGGKLKFTPALDANGVAYASFTFQVQDDGGTADGGVDLDPTPNTIAINVTPVNDPPQGANPRRFVGINTAATPSSYTFAVADFGFSDPSDANDIPPAANRIFDKVKITALPTKGTLTLAGNPVALNDEISVANIPNLKYTPALDPGTNVEKGRPYASFTFKVMDAGSNVAPNRNIDQSDRPFLIDVLVPPQAPTAVDATYNLDEDGFFPDPSKSQPAMSAATFGFADLANTSSEFPAGNNLVLLQITQVPDPAFGKLVNGTVDILAPTLIPVAQLSLLKFVPTANSFDSATHTRPFFKFKLQDDGDITTVGGSNVSLEHTLFFNVVEINDPPTGTNRIGGTALAVNEDATYAFGVSGTTGSAFEFGFADALDDLPSDHSQVDQPASVRIKSLPVNGQLKFAGSDVSVDTDYPASQISSFTFQPNTNLNSTQFSAQDAFSFKFQLKDNGGVAGRGVDIDQTKLYTIAFSVASLNDPPSGTDKQITIQEDSSYNFAAADFGFGDSVDSPNPNSLSGVFVRSLPAGGTLFVGFTPVLLGDRIDVAQFPSLRFVPQANANDGNQLRPFVTFAVQDDGGTPFGGIDTDPTPNTLTFSIGSVNDPPIGLSGNVTALEDNDYTFTTADFGFTDPSDLPANSLAAVIISTLPPVSQGTLTLSGVPIPAGTTVLASLITSGNLRYRSPNNAFGPNLASFTYQLRDDGLTANGGVDTEAAINGIGPHVLTITVAPVNDAPIGGDSFVTTNKNTSYTFKAADFPFSDPIDNNANGLMAIKIPSLALNGGTLRFLGTQVNVGDAIPIASVANLIYTPPTGFYGSQLSSFTFQVQDNGGTANGGVDRDPTARGMSINVQRIHSAPQGNDAILTTLEDTAVTFQPVNFGFSDPNDAPADNFTSVLVTVPPASVGTLFLGSTPQTAGTTIQVAVTSISTLYFLPAANKNGNAVANIAYQVKDDGGTADGGDDTDRTLNTLTINVTPVNDPPSGQNNTATAIEDINYAFTLADFASSSTGTFDPVDLPNSNALKAVQIVSLPTAGATLTLSGSPVTVGQTIDTASIFNGLLRFRAPADKFGPNFSKLSFRVQDDGGAANGGVDLSITPSTLTLDVIAVNDPPVGTDVTINAPENGSYTFAPADFPITDPRDAPSGSNSLAHIVIQATPLKGSLTNNGVNVNAGTTITATDILSGKLVYTPIAYQSGIFYASLTFFAKDDGGTANGGVDAAINANTVTINIPWINQRPLGTSQTITTLEDTTYTVRTADFGFTDPNDTPSNIFISVEITAPPIGGTLRLNNGPAITSGFIKVSDINAGLLRFTPTINLNGFAAAKITFKVKDDGGTANGGSDQDSIAKTLSLDITSINDEPQGTDKTINPSGQSNVLLEDSSYQFAAADFGFFDPNDSPSNSLATIQITSLPSAGTLSIGSSTVAFPQVIPVASINLLRFTPAPNAYGPSYASFGFQVQDDGSTANGGRTIDSTPNLITLNVTSVNDPPVITLGPAPQLVMLKSFGTPPFTSTHTFTASDFGVTDPGDYPNTNQFQSVTFTSGLNGAGILLFNGNPVANGTVIPVTNLTQLVYTAPTFTSTASFTFNVQDDGPINNTSAPATFNIQVSQPVNSAPTGSDLTVSTLEDTEYLVTENNFGYSDPDTPPNSLQAVSITALNLNGGTFQLNGTNVVVNQFIPASDIRLGRLRYKPPLNLAGNNFANIQFRVQDNGDTSQGGINTDPTPDTLTINVVAVNDAPAGTPFSITLDEDTAYTFAPSSFGLTDVNDVGPNKGPISSLASVKFTTIPFNGQLIYGLNTAVHSGDFVSAANLSTLRFIPAANASGNNYGNFTFQVQDGGGTANGGQDLDPTPRLATVNVASVNDAPQSFGSTVTITEGSAGYTIQPGDFGFSDPNDIPSNLPLTLQINALSLIGGTLSNNGTAILGPGSVPFSNIAGGKLIYTPASAAANGNATISFKITDDGGLIGTGAADTDFVPHTLTISILPHNSPPQGEDRTLTIVEDNSYTFSASSFGFSDVLDGPNQNSFSAVKIVAVPAAGSLLLDVTPVAVGEFIPLSSLSTLRFIPAPNTNGATYASFTFQVQDNGGLFNGGLDLDPTPNTLTFNVIPVNDPPVTLPKTIATLEDFAYTFTSNDFAFSDPSDAIPNGGPINSFQQVILQAPSSGTILFSSVVQNVFPIFVTVAQINSGNLTFLPPFNANNTNSFSPLLGFQVRDTGGVANGGIDTSTQSSLNFSVTPVNDPPIGTPNTIGLLEDNSYTFREADFGFTDPADQPVNPGAPNQSFASINVVTAPFNGTLRNGALFLGAGSEIPITSIRNGQLVFKPNANQNGLNYGNFTFKVRDTGSNVAPNVNLDTVARLMIVHVIPVNDAPSGASRTVTTLEDTAYTITQSDLGFTDFNDLPSNTLLNVVIPAAPRGGTLFDSAGPMTVFPHTIPASDFGIMPYTGSVRFVPNANLNSPSTTFDLKFQVRDSGGIPNGGIDLDPTPRTLAFTVTPINDPPIGKNLSTTILENQQLVSSSAPGRVFTADDFCSPIPALFDPDNIPGSEPFSTLTGIHITSIPTGGTLFTGSTPITNTTTVIPVSAINAGQLKFVPNQFSNSSLLGAPSFSFTFKVRDDGGTANGGVDEDVTNRTASFTVTAVNTQPSGTDNTLTTNEDTSLTLVPSNFGFWEVIDNPTTPNQQLSAVIIATLPPASAGTLTFGGVPLTQVDIPRFVLVAAGAFVQPLTFQPAPNVNGPAQTSFAFQVQDNGGTANGGNDVDQSPNTITLNVNSVPDSPRGTPNTIEVLANTTRTFTASDFGFGDPLDVPPNHLVAVNITNLTGTGFQINGTPIFGSGPYRVVFGVDSFRFVAGGNPRQQTFQFNVEDDGPANNFDLVARTFTIQTVLPPNSPPTGRNHTVTDALEDTPYTFTLGTANGTTGDFQYSDATSNRILDVKIVALPQFGQLTNSNVPVSAGQVIPAADITAGKLKFVPLADANGAAFASFTFQLRDDGGTVASGGLPGVDLDPTPRTMTLNVTPVNDPPSFVAGVDQNATDEMGIQAVVHWASAISAGPPNEAAQKLHFVIQTNTHPALFAAGPAVDGAGTLTFTPAPNVSGAADITLVLLDDAGGNGASPSQTFHVTITKPHRLYNTTETGPRRGLDVTGSVTTAPDGFIAPGDALAVINYINAHGSGPVPANSPFGPPYCDVDGDGFVVASDALKVINYINANPVQSEGEGEPSAASQLVANSLPNDLISLLAFDIAEHATRRRR